MNKTFKTKEIVQTSYEYFGLQTERLGWQQQHCMSRKTVRIEIYEKIDQALGVTFNTEKAFGSQLKEHFEATLTYSGWSFARDMIPKTVSAH